MSISPSRLRKLRAKHGKAFNGGIGEEQIFWLKKQLGDACRRKQRAVVFLHQGLRPEGERTNLWNDFILVQTLSTFHCLSAVINGHAHKFLYDFKYTKYRQVHFVTFGGMVQSPFTSFGFADFYEDELHIHGLIFGRQIEYHLNLTMHAKPENNEEKYVDEKEEKLSRRPTIVSPRDDTDTDDNGEKLMTSTKRPMMPNRRTSASTTTSTNSVVDDIGMMSSSVMMLTVSAFMVALILLYMRAFGGRGGGGKTRK